MVVASNKQEACLALDAILTENRFGKAGQTVVVEELLQGEEVSVCYIDFNLEKRLYYYFFYAGFMFF